MVSSGSDLLVKVNVDGSGKLTNTVDADTTRYIDLNDPANPATAGANAGKNPQGIAINKQGTRAYVAELRVPQRVGGEPHEDSVVKVIRTAPLPAPGTPEEVVAVGAEMFFSSRGLFNKAAGQLASNQERLSSEGWQSCSSCHFKGLTDSSRVAVRGRAAEVRSAERELQPTQPQRATGTQLLRDLRRDRGLRGQHPQCLRAGRAGGAAPLQRPAPRDEHARPEPRTPVRRRR